MDKNAVEFRAALPLEIKSDDSAGFKIGGYAAVFDTFAGDGYFREQIATGALDGRLQDDVRLLINHEGLPMARVGSGTLALSIDARGLYMETVLDPEDPDTARIVSKMRRGDLREMSFAFIVEDDEWEEGETYAARTVTKIKELIDVSIVTTPFYPTASVALRSLDAHRAAVTVGAHVGANVARSRAMKMALDLIK